MDELKYNVFGVSSGGKERKCKQERNKSMIFIVRNIVVNGVVWNRIGYVEGREWNGVNQGKFYGEVSFYGVVGVQGRLF